MDYEAILFDVKDRVATITLNRPERMNAWNAQMAAELSDALHACGRAAPDPAVADRQAGDCRDQRTRGRRGDHIPP